MRFTETEEIETPYLSLIEKYCPTVAEYLAPNHNESQKLEDIFRRRIDFLSLPDDTLVDLTFVDRLIMAENDDQDAIQMFDFIEESMKNIAASIGPDTAKLRRCLYSMVSADGVGARYRHFIAEIAVEQKLESGKTADFTIEIAGQIRYAEVFSIDFLADKIGSDQDFVDFVKGRMEKKKDSKKINREKEVVVLFPVIWGDVERILRFRKGIEALYENFIEDQAFGPMVVASVSPDNQIWRYDLVPLQHLAARSN